MRFKDSEDLILAEIGQRREGNDLATVGVTMEVVLHGLKMQRELASCNFVRFCQDNEIRNLIVLQPIDHHLVEFCQSVSCVDDLNCQSDLLSFLKVIFDEFPPARSHLLRDFRVAVAGKIYKVELLIEKVVVDLTRFPRGLTNACKVSAAGEFVDEGGFSNIRSSQEDDFRLIGFWKLRGTRFSGSIRNADEEFC